MISDSKNTEPFEPFEPIRSNTLPPLPKIVQIAMLVDDQNYSQVDVYAQHILRVLPNDPHANLACAWVASHFGLTKHQNAYFNKAKASITDRSISLISQDLRIDINVLANQSPEGNRQKTCQNQDSESRFHLSKAWGFGFGSEMSALMGQAYLAEMSNRKLVVHWGENFLYRPSEGVDCVFDCYFEPFNQYSISDVEPLIIDVYPPKWNKDNLYLENNGKRTGEYSQLSALYFLNRDEALTISDYYSGLVNSLPWVRPGWPLSHLTLDDAYRYLAKKYLRPKSDILDEVDAFVKQSFSSPFIAVHARGSDKDEGYRALTLIPKQTLEKAKQRLSEMPKTSKIFLMTDDTALLEIYKKEFGSRLVQTDCQRCDTQVGVHYDQNTDKLRAGREMLIDMLIAARADCFIGLGLSNPSQLICYFGDFKSEDYILFGENRLKQFNTHLYKTISVKT